jgi:acyl-CoA reductase-like NAD-dependent aldehyde dehydrogenase
VTDEAIAAPRLGSVDVMRVAELWAECYQGEVLGETIFGLVADQEPDGLRRHQLEVLTQLERATKELAGPVFERNGYDRGDTDATVASARAGAAAAAQMSWTEFLASIEPVADTFLSKYRELVELVDNEADRAVAEAYVAHELALVEFARRALGAGSGDPIEPILALPHVAAALR